VRIAAIALAVLLALTGCDQNDETARAQSSTPAPAWALERLDGGVIDHLKDYRGKVVVLNVWATWCGPCRREMPSLQKLSETLDPQRFIVLGLATDDDPALVREYLRAKGIRFARHIDRGGHESGLPALPATFVIGADGTVRWSGYGEKQWDDAAVASWLTGLL
jgi:thiol-disulfide isomerase/thioredoxin